MVDYTKIPHPISGGFLFGNLKNISYIRVLTNN